MYLYVSSCGNSFWDATPREVSAVVEGRLEFEKEKMANLATLIAVQTRGKRILSPDELFTVPKSPLEQAKELESVTKKLLEKRRKDGN